MRLYFVLQPQVFQLVPWQPLTQVVQLFFTVQLPVIQSLFSLLLFHLPSLSSSSRILDLASHSFQFGFAHAAFPFYSSYLQQLGFFFILSNTVFLVIQFSLQAYILQSSQKILYFFSKKKKLQYRFRFDFAITTVGFQFK